jgi:hypothetical protein
LKLRLGFRRLSKTKALEVSEMRKAAYKANGVPFKILSRVLFHPAFQAGYPVRFRVASDITKPTIRFNWHWLDVRLPATYGRHIGTLARLVRQFRNGANRKRLKHKGEGECSKAPLKSAL